MLFLALGANRRRAVVTESALVAADGRAVVLIDNAKSWQRDTFAPGVEVIELARLEARHAAMRVERLFLYRGPRFLLYRVIGRGPLRPAARRAAKAYEKKFADRVHRRVFLPAYRRVWGDVRSRLVDQHVLAGRRFDTLVVADALSIQQAARILRASGDGGTPPTVCYSIDHVVREVSAARVG